MTAAIAPGAWLGLLGGGQLGRMFCMAAQSLGYKVAVIDPGDHSPAGSVADRHIRADYLDPGGLAALAALAAAATTEFENVPAAALTFLARTARVSPAAASVAIAQDRIQEKNFLARCGVAVAPYAVLRVEGDAREASTLRCCRASSKARASATTARARYASHRDEAVAAFARHGRPACVLEQLAALDCEVSVMVARSERDETATWPVAENRHRDGILDVSIVPARIRDELAGEARATATAVAERSIIAACSASRCSSRRGGAARQRDRAAPAQQRPLHDRRLRHLAVRAAGAGAGGAAARRARARTSRR